MICVSNNITDVLRNSLKYGNLGNLKIVYGKKPEIDDSLTSSEKRIIKNP